MATCTRCIYQRQSVEITQLDVRFLVVQVIVKGIVTGKKVPDVVAGSHVLGAGLSRLSLAPEDHLLWQGPPPTTGPRVPKVSSYALHHRSRVSLRYSLAPQCERTEPVRGLICTVSDHLLTKEELSAKAREQSFANMVEIALETARVQGQDEAT